MLQMLRPLEELQKASLRFPLQCAATRRIDTAVAALQWVQSCSHQMGMGARAEPDVLERLAEAGTRVRADVAALPAPPLNTPELAPQHDALVAARAAREQWVARALRALDSACALADVRVLLADPAGAVGTATEQLLLELYAGWLERGAPPLGQQQRRAARGGWAKDSVYWVAWKGWLPWPAVIEEIKREAPVAGGAAGGAAGAPPKKRLTLRVRFLHSLGGRPSHREMWIEADAKRVVPYTHTMAQHEARLQIDAYAGAVREAQLLVRQRHSALCALKATLRATLRGVFPALREVYAARCKGSKLKAAKVVGVHAERAAPAPTSAQEAMDVAQREHTARDDETPAQIARMHGVDLAALLDENRARYGPGFVRNAHLFEGTVVVLPLTASALLELRRGGATRASQADPRSRSQSDPRNKSRKRSRGGSSAGGAAASPKGSAKACASSPASAAKRARIAHSVAIDSSAIAKLRATARTKLAQLLSPPGGATPPVAAVETAYAIESGLANLNALPAQRAAYVEKFRMLTANLGKNADLRERVMEGECDLLFSFPLFSTFAYSCEFFSFLFLFLYRPHLARRPLQHEFGGDGDAAGAAAARRAACGVPRYQCVRLVCTCNGRVSARRLLGGVCLLLHLCTRGHCHSLCAGAPHSTPLRVSCLCCLHSVGVHGPHPPLPRSPLPPGRITATWRRPPGGRGCAAGRAATTRAA